MIKAEVLGMGVFRKRIYDPSGPYTTKDGRRYRLDDYWWIDYRVNGKRRYERVSKSKRVAMDRLGKVKAEIREGKFFDKKQVPPPVRFAEFAQIYLENHCKANNRSWKRAELSLKHLISEFGNLNLHELTLWHAEKYRSKRLKQVKPATVYQEIACLKNMYKKAVEWGKLLPNPLQNLKNPKPKNERLRYLTTEEIERLLDACKSDDPKRAHLYPIVVVALHTGMRRGEILNLTWDKVDFENKLIIVTNTKNDEYRIIPMSQTVYEILKELAQNQKSSYVFCNKDGKNFGKVQKAFKQALKKQA